MPAPPLHTLRFPGLLLALAATAVPPTAPAAESPDARTLALQAAPAPAVRQGGRVALVIGNAAYREGPLANPVNDARAMAAVLKDSGFQVMLHTDLDHKGMLQAVRDFGNRLRQGQVGLFYFAGHGLQIKGRNYLVPIGADIQREDEVAYAALDAQAVLDKMESAGNGTNLMILDACRNNPFARSFRSGSSGLAQMDAPVGTLVAFATAPGTVASDGQGSNGLYTQNLLATMRKPGLKVEEVFKQVRVAVRRDSGGKQVPWESTSMEGDLYFFGAPSAVAAAPSSSPAPAPAPVSVTAPAAVALPAPVPVPVPGLTAAAPPRPATSPSPSPSPSPAARPGPVAGAQAVPLPAATSGGADRDRRTQELLAELARPAPGRPAPAVAAAPAGPNAAAARSPATNQNGYAAGDLWSFQVVDKWRGEVVRNYSLRVARIGAQGELHTAAGTIMDAWARPKLLVDQKADRRRSFEPALPRGWDELRPGSERPFAYAETMSRLSGDRLWHCDHKGTVKVGGTEPVRVPAGEFMARRIEVDGQCSRQTTGQSDSFHYWRHVIWYVPELRYYAAIDIEWRDGGGRLERREREELTSYVLQTGPLAQR